jgi:hypothetical protein
MARKRNTARRAPQIAGPTPERLVHGGIELVDVVDKQSNGRTIVIGKANRFVPMIDTLKRQEVISPAEHKALAHYRHHADLADKSPTKDSLNRQRFGGSGNGPTHEILHAQRVRDLCEGAAGSLRDILRAVVIEDQSLSQWAIQRFGGKEQTRQRGAKTETTVEPSRLSVSMCKLELRAAARRVQEALDGPAQARAA